MIVLTGTPRGGNRYAADFADAADGRTTSPAALNSKIANAIAHKAAAVLIVSGRPPALPGRATAIGHLARAQEELLNDLLSLLACHVAVRAGDRLTPEEIAALVRQRDRADSSHHCPHGRPTSFVLTLHDLERQFRAARSPFPGSPPGDRHGSDGPAVASADVRSHC